MKKHKLHIASVLLIAIFFSACGIRKPINMTVLVVESAAVNRYTIQRKQ